MNYLQDTIFCHYIIQNFSLFFSRNIKNLLDITGNTSTVVSGEKNLLSIPSLIIQDKLLSKLIFIINSLHFIFYNLAFQTKISWEIPAILYKSSNASSSETMVNSSSMALLSSSKSSISTS